MITPASVTEQDPVFREYINWPGMVAHTFNPSTLGGWDLLPLGRQIIWGREFETAWATWQNLVSTESTKIS